MGENQFDPGNIKNDLKVIKDAVIALSQKVDQQSQRINFLESSVGIKRQEEVASPEPKIVESPEPAVVAQSAPVAEVIQEKSSLEENIGGKLFARVGIVALVLGISFFLKYAFDNNWIGETGRVIIGIISGLALLAFGEKYIRKYHGYAQLITGGGIVVLYLSIFAAFNFYHLIGQIPAFIVMAMITAIGIVLSLRYDSMLLMITAVLGGFTTPFLISNGQNNQVELLSYILMLDISIMAVSFFKKWNALNIIGFIGTFIVFSSWAEEFYREAYLGTTMTFLTLFFVVYSISSLIYNIVRKEKSTGVEQLLTLVSAIAYFSFSYSLLDHKYHDFMGFFSMILAIYYFMWAYAVKASTPEDENLYSFLALLTVGFVTLAIPIQFEQKVITAGWVIEAMILIYLGARIKRDSIKMLGVVVFGLAFLRLVFFDSAFEESEMTIFNSVFFIFMFTVVVSYLVAALLKFFADDGADESKFASVKQLIALLIITGNFLTIFAISREIVFYYERQIKNIQSVQQDNYYPGRNSSLPEYGTVERIKNREMNYEKINKLKSKSSVSLSLFWLLYGIILMTIGVVIRSKEARVGGLIILILAILKLFFYDLWSLGTLYRIISSMSLGLVLLGISFVYQKYKSKIKEII